METFVLRIFPLDASLDAELHGQIEHVSSGARAVFHTSQDLLSALSEMVTEIASEPSEKPVATPP